MSDMQHIVSIIGSITQASMAVAFAVVMYRLWKPSKNKEISKQQLDAVEECIKRQREHLQKMQ